MVAGSCHLQRFVRVAVGRLAIRSLSHTAFLRGITVATFTAWTARWWMNRDEAAFYPVLISWKLPADRSRRRWTKSHRPLYCPRSELQQIARRLAHLVSTPYSTNAGDMAARNHPRGCWEQAMHGCSSPR